ncbi:MAG: hypothetical protein CBD27_11715 [Rhodospirillaceae bacterium TMED167]|nr:hypothetical protein [Rhodospirillaceae bacterium]OUW24046.1 MAG: hypothetical protein CBD27_11715 [Rhodospirillaceae bacterium TMED167]
MKIGLLDHPLGVAHPLRQRGTDAIKHAAFDLRAHIVRDQREPCVNSYEIPMHSNFAGLFI